MKKNYLISYLYLLGISLILLIILTITNYFINYNTTIPKILIPIISILVSTIILGKKTKKKAYLEGIKFSSIYIIFISLIKLILKSEFNYKTFIIYFLIIFSGIIGEMIGINLKK